MAEGQYTGQKDSYVYLDDSGGAFSLQRDRSLILGAATGLTLYEEGDPYAPSFPKRFKPRGVYWQGYLDTRIVRKFIICGTPDSPLYSANSSTPVTIDGVAGTTTGKRGEQITFVKRSRTVPNP